MQLADRREWEEFVKAHPEGNVFQMPWMYDIFLQTKRHLPIAFFAFEEGVLVGLLVAVRIWNSVFPLSVFTRRQIVVGGPLVKNNDASVLMALLKALGNYGGRKIGFSEIRNLSLSLSLKPIYEEAGFQYESYLSVVVEMHQSSQKMWAGLSSYRQDSINRLAYLDYVIRDLSDKEEIKNAWQLLNCSLSRRGRAVPDFSLYRAAYESEVIKPFLRFKGLFVDNILKVSVLILEFKNRAYIWYEGDCLQEDEKWMYDGLLWGLMIEMQSNDIQYLDMGAGGRPGENFYMHEYKKSFGGMIKETGRYIFIHNVFLWNSANILYGWHKKLKMFVAKHINKYEDIS